MKKTLVFYSGKPPHGSRTDWVMHEYRLVTSETTQNKNSIQSPVMTVENWVLCRIFLKKRSAKNEDAETCNVNGGRKLRTSKPVFYDFMRKERADLNLAPTSSSSGTSGITEISSSESDDHEESSCNSFPCFRRKQ